VSIPALGCVSIDAMPRARKPATQAGFSATPANPQALLGEAERLASAHALLDAQARLGLIEPALGRTPRFRLIQGYVCFQLGRLDRALALLKPLAERQDSISPLASTFLADACHHAGDRSGLWPSC
jgi:predicted Zn-dependent protease